jgi:hypothetical protein
MRLLTRRVRGGCVKPWRSLCRYNPFLDQTRFLDRNHDIQECNTLFSWGAHLPWTRGDSKSAGGGRAAVVMARTTIARRDNVSCTRTLCQLDSPHSFTFNRESIAFENPLAFFPFVGAFVESDTFSSLDNLPPDKLYNRTLQHAISAGFLSDPASLAAVELDLALHIATPKIEAFYQHYVEHVRSDSVTEKEDCRSWVDWYGTTVCDVETLARLARAGAEPPDDSHP